MTPAPSPRRTAALLGLVGAALLGLVPAAAAAPAAPAAPAAAVGPGASGHASWLVSVAPGQAGAAQRAVRESGGQVVRSYDELDVLAVRASRSALTRLLTAPSVLGARADSRVTVTEEATSDRQAPTRNVYRETVRSAAVADQGGTGAGVTVAVIDTGVSAVPELADRLVPVEGLDGQPATCVNFTDEPTCDDTYGHGTFLAGLIAGGGAHPGMSSARVLSVKLAGASGAADTSTLLAAIQWVVAHREAHGIRVLNLSLGTPSGASWRVDPLNYAVERAVDAGILVVVSAGNTGPDPQSVMKPGDDPYVLTVGASDDRGTPGRGDDAVPLFSAQGPTKADGLAKPDVVAPGSRLISLRSPGSTVEQNVPGGVDAAYRRGSGTSMATAVVSGAAAQLLSLRPAWTPNHVKTALRRTATPVAGQPESVVGRGLVDIAAAAAWTGTAPGRGSERSTGGGSLDGARGWVRVLDRDTGAEISGEQRVDGGSFDAAGYRATGWTRATWASSAFAGTRWEATEWQGTNWQGTNWQGTNWQGTNWQGTNWQGTNWQGTNWQGSTSDPTAYYGRPGHGSAVLGAWE